MQYALCGILMLLGFFGTSLHAEENDVSSLSSSMPDPAEPHLQLGVDFFLTDELEAAIGEFQEAIRLRPGYADAYHNLGVALAKTGDLTGALAAWSEAERLDFPVGSLRYHLSSLISYNYGISLARQGKLEQAMEQWQAALRMQPDFSEAHYALGLGFLTAGNPVPAAAHFKEALRAMPDWPKALEALGLAHFASHEFTLAEQVWRQALALNPDFPQVHAHLGLLRLQEGQWQQAIAHSRHAVELQPELVAAHMNLGAALLANGDEAASLEPLERALSLDSRLTSARLLLGVAWSRLGNWARAASIWREDLRLDAFSPDAVRLHYNLGLAMTAMGDMDEAIAEFLVVTHQRPEWAPGWSQLGSAYLAKRQWEKAVPALETAARLQPAWAHLHFSVGKARAEQGMLPQAATAFQRAVEIDPGLIDGWFHLGVVLRAQNLSGKAVEALQIAAEGGVRKAQNLLAAMYANGSGVERKMAKAILWWSRSSRAPIDNDETQAAKDHLSRLRREVHQHRLLPHDRQEVLEGFELVRRELHRQAPFQGRSPYSSNETDMWEQQTPVEPVLNWVIQQALALDRSAQQKLRAWYGNGKSGQSSPADARIHDYFLQTGKEGNPYSCQVLESSGTLASDVDLREWQLTQHECLNLSKMSQNGDGNHARH